MFQPEQLLNFLTLMQRGREEEEEEHGEIRGEGEEEGIKVAEAAEAAETEELREVEEVEKMEEELTLHTITINNNNNNNNKHNTYYYNKYTNT